MSRLQRGCMLFFMGFMFVGAGLLCLYLFGQVYTLTCRRLQSENPTCIREALWMGKVSLGESTFEGVSGARVGESCDADGCTYRVYLSTAQGSVPFSGFSSSGRDNKVLLAQQINEYVAETEVKTLEVETEDPWWIVIFTAIFVFAGLCMLLAAPLSVLFGR